MPTPKRHVTDLSTGQVYERDYTPEELQVAERIAAETLLDRMTGAVQAMLDTAARARGYDDIRSAVSYADEPAVELFQTEGRAFRAWRSRVWAHCYTVLADVQAGQRSIPTAAELLAELPALDL